MTTNTSPGRPPKYPWRTMEIGESFLVIGRSSTCIHRDASRCYKPRRFSCRKIMTNGQIKVKVTRIA